MSAILLSGSFFLRRFWELKKIENLRDIWDICWVYVAVLVLTLDPLSHISCRCSWFWERNLYRVKKYVEIHVKYTKLPRENIAFEGEISWAFYYNVSLDSVSCELFPTIQIISSFLFFPHTKIFLCIELFFLFFFSLQWVKKVFL